MRIPPRAEIGQLHQTPLYQLWHQFKAVEDGTDEYLSRADRGPVICGFILPPFQREFVWTMEQQVRFIESAFAGLPIGTYTYNSTNGIKALQQTDADGKTYYAMDRWLLDGQQRLTTFQRYFRDEFTVYGLKFSELTPAEHMGLLMNTSFPSYITKFDTELACRDLYDRMAFGGTNHQEHERALPLSR